MTRPVICALLLLCVLGFSAAFRTQSVGVKGKLRCGATPAGNVQVKLVDIDTGGPDDEIDSGYTTSHGMFTLSGSTKELTTIDPVLKIYHNCNDGVIPCERKWKITIPEKYISRTKQPAKTFDIGELNLEVELDDEEHDCIH